MVSGRSNQVVSARLYPGRASCQFESANSWFWTPVSGMRSENATLTIHLFEFGRFWSYTGYSDRGSRSLACSDSPKRPITG